jgi:DNA-binding response OmpR family regulator
MNRVNSRVLLVEDDPYTISFLSGFLQKKGYYVKSVKSVNQALEEFDEYIYDCILLDFQLQGAKNGMDFLEAIRKRHIFTPIIVLSGVWDKDNLIEMLGKGADDYLIKPFHPSELVARMETIKTRFYAQPVKRFDEVHGYKFCWDNHLVRKGDKVASLTKKETHLLQLLVRSRHKVMSSADIFRKIWTFSTNCRSNVLQTLIRRLRKKLFANFGDILIYNVHGLGYIIKFKEDEKTS